MQNVHHVRFLQDCIDCGEEANIEPLRRRQCLVHPGTAALVAQHDIGERPADVDGHRVMRHTQVFLSVASFDNMF